MKVLTLVGTRPELIKLSATIKELDARVEHVLVHSGQNYDYELNEVFFQELGLRAPDHYLDAAKGGAAQTIAKVIERFDEVLEKEKPDALLLLGDTNSCLGVISAKRRKIPIFHMEAGNRCFDQRVPEEINRKVVDHLSDINLVYTEHARRYLIAEGLRPETVIKTGSPMKEVLLGAQEAIEQSSVLQRLDLKPAGYFLVSAHREENVDTQANLRKLLACLARLGETYDLPIIFSTHPRTKARLDALFAQGVEADKRIRFMKPLGFSDYCCLQKNARCVLSDSGTITEESSILSFPAVTVREAHERPEGMDEGTVIMTGLEADAVLLSVQACLAHYAEAEQRPFRIVSDYDGTATSKKVLRIILSYTGYVNRTVWRKYHDLPAC